MDRRTPHRFQAFSGRRLRAGTALAGGATALLLNAALAADPALSVTEPTNGVTQSAALSGVRGGKVTTELEFTFNRGESLNPNTVVHDVSGHGNNGFVRVSGGGDLRRVEGVTGKAAAYPCRGCGRALISVPDARYLDPARRPFWFGAAIRLRDYQAVAGRDPNIMQKGYINQSGGRWKLELIGTRPQCTVTGSAGTLVVRSDKRVDDDTWHFLRCRRTSGTLSLYIDGNRDQTATGPTGRISNTAPVKIGAKALGSAGGNDQYHGKIDNTYVTIDRR